MRIYAGDGIRWASASISSRDRDGYSAPCRFGAPGFPNCRNEYRSNRGAARPMPFACGSRPVDLCRNRTALLVISRRVAADGVVARPDGYADYYHERSYEFTSAPPRTIKRV